MEKFRNSSLRVLIATDVASRGLDVKVTSHTHTHTPSLNLHHIIPLATMTFALSSPSMRRVKMMMEMSFSCSISIGSTELTTQHITSHQPHWNHHHPVFHDIHIKNMQYSTAD